MNAHGRPPTGVSFTEALRYWFRLGFISFGGPAGQIALMHQELVERRRWISEKRFMHALNYCMLLPGPEAQQLATYIGWLMHRTWGGIMAGALFVLPSMFILMALTWIYLAFGDIKAVAGTFYGIKPAVTAIVLFAAWRIGSKSLKNATLWTISVAAFIAIFFFGVPFPLIVMGAALAGYLGEHLMPQRASADRTHDSIAASSLPALIDDDTPTPDHARFRWTRLAMIAGATFVLWAIALGLLTVLYGWDSTFTRIGWFFTKAALLTFGGAYAVLPYVYQGAVEQYQWLTATQMIDGLALGETTPGPLIMVVAYVGFVGAWTQMVFGPDARPLAGCIGAAIATFFTFLPSFFFILAGGPAVESTHGNLHLSAPLAGITAAVVGVIVNLALFFAWHTLWPTGWHGSFEWFSAIVGACAAIVIWRYGTGMIPVIAGCGTAGLLHHILA